MPPIRRSLNGLLNEYAGLIPVDQQLKPNLLVGQPRILQPTLSFRPSPLADQTVAIESGALSTALVGAENTISWASTPNVPSGEVHRYTMLGVGHNSATPEEFVLFTVYARGDLGGFSSGLEAHKNIQSARRTNMLAGSSQSGADQHYYNNPHYDLYPGGSFLIFNSTLLDLLTDATLQFNTIRMIGPDTTGPADITDEVTASAS